MNTASSGNGFGICPWNSGPFSSRTIIPASSIGPPFRPIRRGSTPTRGRKPHQAGGAVREGSALLQGLVTCGHCGRRLHDHYRGRNSTPGYHCAGKDLVNGRGVYCLNVGGMVIEQAVANAFLEAITPAASKPRGSRSNNSKPTTMRRCRSGGWKWSALATRRSGPSAAIGPWSPKIDWSLAGWKPNGRIVCAIWPPPKWNCAAASNNDPARSAPSNSNVFRCSAPIFVKSGRADHHGSRSQGTAAHAAGRSDSESQASRRSRAPDAALARRRDHHAGCSCPAIQADGAAHRRRYHLAASPPGRSLSR